MAYQTNTRHRQGTGVSNALGKSGGGKSGLSMAFKRIMERANIKGRLLRKAKGLGAVSRA